MNTKIVWVLLYQKTKRVLVWTLLALFLISYRVEGGEKNPIYNSPQEIRPLLIGARVPELKLRTSDSLLFDLGKTDGSTQSILVFYRGWW